MCLLFFVCVFFVSEREKRVGLVKRQLSRLTHAQHDVSSSFSVVRNSGALVGAFTIAKTMMTAPR